MKISLSLAICLVLQLTAMSQDYFLLTGTYTNGSSRGIYINHFDGLSGKITAGQVRDSVENPSYLAVSENRRFVYAVNENGGSAPGEVSAFEFDSSNGTLRFLNKQPTSGDHPCYVSTDRTGRWVFTANYTGGSLTAFPVEANGALGASAQHIQFGGKGVTSRQEKPHVHSTIFTPDQKYLLVTDLGLDRIMVYKFDPKAAKPLSPARPVSFSVEPGSGPRHLSFHPSAPYVYIINELTGSVSTFHFKGSNFTQIQNISSHPENYAGAKGSADIHVSPDGRFVYASNRGDANSIAIFAVDQHSGKLTFKGAQSTMGTHPRNFTIDPSGKFLLVANRDSNHIVVFSINQETGMLTATGEPFHTPAPVYLGLLRK